MPDEIVETPTANPDEGEQNAVQQTEAAPEAEATETVLGNAEQESSAEPEAEQRVPLDRLNAEIYKKKALERQLEEIKAQQDQQQVAQRTIQQAEAGKPTLESAGYDEAKFAEQLMDWKLDQRDQIAKNQKAQQAQQKMVGSYRSRQEEYSAKNPNYHQLAYQADQAGIKFSDDVAEAIMTGDAGVKVHHHLLSNPARIEEINAMSPVARMREIFKLEQKFGDKPATVKKVAGTISPVAGGTTGGAQSMNNEQMGSLSPSAYYEMRMAQRKK